MTAVLDAVVARLDAVVVGREVYARAVPDGPIPAEYLLVRESVSGEFSARSVGTVHAGEHLIRVLSVARGPRPDDAAHVADVGAERARAALRNYRPAGQWVLRYDLGSDPYRDEDLPDWSFIVASQYFVRSSL